MAGPWGGHPTLDRFLEWAKENGCTGGTKVRSDHTGRAFTSLELVGPHGGRVAMVVSAMDERLVPSQVAYMHRRLGLKTPFASTPEHADPEKTEYVQESGLPFEPPLKGEKKKP
jgi:hypothetical protein